MKKFRSIIWIAVFLCMIVIPALIYPDIAGYIDSDNHENRKKAGRPILRVENYQTLNIRQMKMCALGKTDGCFIAIRMIVIQ